MEQFRREVMTATVLGVSGKLQREDGVTHIIADKLVDLSGMLQSLTDNTRIARANNAHPRNLRWATPAAGPSDQTSPVPQNLDQLEQRHGKQQNTSRLKVDSHDFH